MHVFLIKIGLIFKSHCPVQDRNGEPKKKKKKKKTTGSIIKARVWYQRYNKRWLNRLQGLHVKRVVKSKVVLFV